MLSHRQYLKWKMHIVKDELVRTANIYPSNLRLGNRFVLYPSAPTFFPRVGSTAPRNQASR